MVAVFECRIGAAPVCAKSTRKVSRVLCGRVEALAMSGIGDAEEPWSEDDLVDLDSALSFGACIEEIAVFLRREVEDVERKAFERNRRPAAAPEVRTIGGREKSNPLADPERSHQAFENQTPETNVQNIGSRSGDP
jgi:hypothetical protein